MSQQINQPPSFLSDSPADSDVLDYKAYRDAIISIISGLTADASLTVGVFGAWGSGKTTLLKMIRDELAKQKTQTIWVNVWQFANEEDVWTAFLQSLLLKIKKEIPLLRRFLFDLGLFRRRINWEKVSQKIPELVVRVVIVVVPLLISLFYLRFSDQSQPGKIVAGAGTLVGTVLGWFLLLQPYLKAIRERVKVDLTGLVKSSELRERVSKLDQFKTYFEDMVASLVGEQGRAIIFVDDLDRCPPDRIVQVLDAIKLFLDIPRCVYVIGLDREIIEQAIKVKFEKYKNPETEAREYLEKIIGLPFDLPPLSGPQMEILVKGLQANLPDAARSTQVFAMGQEPNPRKVKRTINMFLMSWLLAQARKELEGVIKPTRLAKIVVLQHSYRDLYLVVTLFPRYLGEIEAYFRDLEQPSRSQGEGEQAGPAGPPDHLKAFAGNDSLRQLLTLHTREDEDANFTSWNNDRYVPIPEDEVRAYIRLTRSVTAEQKKGPAVSTQRVNEVFVNRKREVDTFLRMLGGDTPERALIVEGGSGMGKTALLGRYASICSEKGIPYSRVSFNQSKLDSDISGLMKAILDGFPSIDFRDFDSLIGTGASIQRITQAFIAGLHSLDKVVLFFDEYETALPHIKDWFVFQFLPVQLRQTNVIVCVAGQMVAKMEMYPDAQGVLKVTLAPFTREDVAEYFQRINVEAPAELIDVVHSVTEGLPAKVARNVGALTGPGG